MGDIPRVSVVYVNWNRKADVAHSVKLLRRQHFRDFEIVVVDNGSSDGSAAELSALPGVRVLALPANRGPAAARNAGVEAARGEYCVFLDSDAALSRRGLGRLVEQLDREPDVGVIGCRILNAYTRKLDQWIYAQRALDSEKQRFDTYSFSAAGAIVRRDLFREVGGFWEKLFIYNEEVELSIRILRNGFRIRYDPDAVVLHRVAPHGRTGRGRYYYFQVRNWIWTYYRHYPQPARWQKVALCSVIDLFKSTMRLQTHHTVQGLCHGLGHVRVIGEHPEKLASHDVARLGRLNQRTRLNLRS